MNGDGHRNRRSFLTRAIGVSAAGAAALVLGAPSEGAQGARRLRVDADPNDPAHSGLTDSDRGAHSDPPGNGRGGRSARRRASRMPTPGPVPIRPAAAAAPRAADAAKHRKARSGSPAPATQGSPGAGPGPLGRYR